MCVSCLQKYEMNTYTFVKESVFIVNLLHNDRI